MFQLQATMATGSHVQWRTTAMNMHDWCPSPCEVGQSKCPLSNALMLVQGSVLEDCVHGCLGCWCSMEEHFLIRSGRCTWHRWSKRTSSLALANLDSNENCQLEEGGNESFFQNTEMFHADKKLFQCLSKLFKFQHQISIPIFFIKQKLFWALSFCHLNCLKWINIWQNVSICAVEQCWPLSMDFLHGIPNVIWT